jgi:hypothetical protein
LKGQFWVKALVFEANPTALQPAIWDRKSLSALLYPKFGS